MPLPAAGPVCFDGSAFLFQIVDHPNNRVQHCLNPLAELGPGDISEHGRLLPRLPFGDDARTVDFEQLVPEGCSER